MPIKKFAITSEPSQPINSQSNSGMFKVFEQEILSLRKELEAEKLKSLTY